jgi:hypothetical protein
MKTNEEEKDVAPAQGTPTEQRSAKDVFRTTQQLVVIVMVSLEYTRTNAHKSRQRYPEKTRDKKRKIH